MAWQHPRLIHVDKFWPVSGKQHGLAAWRQWLPTESCVAHTSGKPSSRAEEDYNTAHKCTHNTVERAISLWKMRFRCLHKTGGCLQSPPQTCVKILTACAVLHNICINNGISQNESDLTQLNDGQEDDDGQEGEEHENQVKTSTSHACSDRENGRSVRSPLIAQRYTCES